MNTGLTTRTNELSTILASVGQAANEAARASIFTDYRSRKASNTITRQDTDLATFATYLAQATGSDAVMGDDLARDPQAWCGVTWGLVDGFVKWALLQEYAVGTVNLKLATVKTYSTSRSAISPTHEVKRSITWAIPTTWMRGWTPTPAATGRE